MVRPTGAGAGRADRVCRAVSGRLLGELELVPDLVPVPQPPADGVADGETVALGNDGVVRGAQGRDLAGVDISGRKLKDFKIVL